MYAMLLKSWILLYFHLVISHNMHKENSVRLMAACRKNVNTAAALFSTFLALLTF